jgi:hypothetical protein
MDVVAAVNGIWQSQYGALVVLSGLLLLALWSSGFFTRLMRIIEEMMLSNWQLALLGAAAIALSLASGYTTFDGLRNFTSAPLLSVLISFGIQGVMLIVAWLIGESFASGMNQRAAGSRGFTAREALLGMILGVTLAGLIFYWLLTHYDAIAVSRAAGVVANWARFADVSLYFLIALLLFAVIAFNFRRGGDISVPYVQTVRLIAKNSMLWVMFLASGAASVFFSFDSHFNAIFSAEQRARAAEIRTLNQVAGVVADIGERAQKVQLAEAERLFETEGWKSYDTHLTKLAHEAAGSQGEIEKYFVQKMEERRRGIIEQQERIAGAERSQSALLRRRDELEAELQRIEPGIGAFEAELAKAQATLNETKQAIAAKRIEASAEDGGVEGTKKRGRGPVYRQRMTELDELQRKLSITDEPRLREAQHQRDRASARIVSLKREIATINGEVAKYKGETFTADQRIKAAERGQQDTEGTRIDPARVLPAFERARAAFRQQPDVERLSAVQAQCGALLSAVMNTPAKDRVRGVDCDPRHAAEAAGRVFALNAGLVAFQANCAGGAKLPQNANTDVLLGFGRKCLQDSGLVSQDSTDIGARLQSIEMNRDDKAHRFVVTWNAFLDGNRLAYLALALAIGVDALVLMAGLFGAAAVKSPLTDLEGREALSAEHLDKVIDGALRATAHPLATIRAILKLSEPYSGEKGFASTVELGKGHPLDADVRFVLVAGASIGAVRADEANSRFLISVGLAKYLYIAANKKWLETKKAVDPEEIRKVIQVALEPDVPTNAAFVLSHIRGMEESRGCIGRVSLDRIPDDEGRDLVRNVMNAGVALGKAIPRRMRQSKLRTFSHGARSDREAVAYDVHGDLFKVLLMYRAGSSALLVGREPPIPLTAEPERGRLGNGATPARPRQIPHLADSRDYQAALSEKLREGIWSDLLNAIDLDIASAARIDDKTVQTAAGAAWQAIQRLAADNVRLRRYLAEIEKSKKDAIHRKYGELRSSFVGKPEALAMLDKAATSIDGLLKPFLLLPEAGVLPELIGRLERAAEHDDGRGPGEDGLLDLLRGLEVEIRRIDKSSPDAWARIAQMIDGNGGDSATNIREMNPVNKSPI